ncbi:sensor histidine kinase, partial [Streptomyces sp. NRRL S-87]|uniref:sensor histidine kinase n=1 Tax=Streptomyces sp. NRRL S-87 TaxID=1463920 RepID=UPI0004C1A96B
MSRLTGWWQGRGSASKVELYTRGSYVFFAVTEVLTVAGAAVGVRSGFGPAELLLDVLICCHAALVGVVSSRGLAWVAGRGGLPVRAVAALVALTAAVPAAALGLAAGDLVEDERILPTLVIGPVGFGVLALVVCLRRVRETVYAVLGAAAGTAVAVLSAGRSWEAVGYGVAALLVAAFFAVTSGFSAWLIRVVWELDHSRELRARLAVAEERLRFGRDLHDVLGRNLAVIALKSELAVQLARRERPEAVDQMVEVQRIARESQREVREVVRGYRGVDLAVELEGARGVLAAAGIDCRVDGSAGGGLPAAVQSALGWVVREATTNVLRHGDARDCLIRLTGGAGAAPAVLEIENDGAPQTPSGTPGSGLAGLRERLAVLGGTLEAGPVAGGRFRLTATVPATAGTGAGAVAVAVAGEGAGA